MPAEYSEAEANNRNINGITGNQLPFANRNAINILDIAVGRLAIRNSCNHAISLFDVVGSFKNSMLKKPGFAAVDRISRKFNMRSFTSLLSIQDDISRFVTERRNSVTRPTSEGLPGSHKTVWRNSMTAFRKKVNASRP
jgi:hypothetical protein